MQRRNFLQALALAAASGLISNRAQAQVLPRNPTIKMPNSVAFFGPNQTIRGVNLGGWLLLEKWIAPAVFDGIKAPDEFRFSLDDGGIQRLREHRESFITEADFRWIAERGLNAVRVPVGYWILEGDGSYIAAPDILDRAFVWAQKYGLGILLDLHGAPGSQNGRDHSGRDGALGWTTASNIARTIDVLESFARRYGQHPNLIGLELLNEPSVHMPLDVITNFSTRAWNKDWSPKPNGQAWLDLVQKQWKTNVLAKTDAAGNLKTRAFTGDYQVTVNANGQKLEKTVSLGEAGATRTIEFDLR